MGIWPKDNKPTQITSCCRSPNSQLFVTADDRGVLKLFRYPCAVANAPFSPAHGHSPHISCVRFSPDSNRVVSVSGPDGCVIQWVVSEGSGPECTGSDALGVQNKSRSSNLTKQANKNIQQRQQKLQQELNTLSLHNSQRRMNDATSRQLDETRAKRGSKHDASRAPQSAPAKVSSKKHAEQHSRDLGIQGSPRRQIYNESSVAAVLGVGSHMRGTRLNFTGMMTP